MKYNTYKTPQQLIVDLKGKTVKCPVCGGTDFTAKESNPLERSVVITVGSNATYKLDDDFTSEQILYDMFCDECGQEVLDVDGDQQF